jgi:hypothetical protein
VTERVAASPCGATVASAHGRAVNLRLESGEFVALTASELPLAANGVTVDLAPDVAFTGLGLTCGQAAVLSADAIEVAEAGVRTVLTGAIRWEPRPAAGRLSPVELAARARAARAVAIAEGDGRSLLPLVWASDGFLESREPARSAAAPAAALRAAAASDDAPRVEDAARGLAGLGPGLTPSGDDYLAGFAAAWVLASESLGRGPRWCASVPAAVLAGAARGASALGLGWIRHATRGEVGEPMAHVFTALLGVTPVGLAPAVRGVIALGSTSGTDWMTGALAGVDAALAAHGGDRTWS